MIYGCVGELVIYHYETISMVKMMIIHRILVYRIRIFRETLIPLKRRTNLVLCGIFGYG